MMKFKVWDTRFEDGESPFNPNRLVGFIKVETTTPTETFVKAMEEAKRQFPELGNNIAVCVSFDV